eukprot:19620-Heterococcus_DN1.PRE.1
MLLLLQFENTATSRRNTSSSALLSIEHRASLRTSEISLHLTASVRKSDTVRAVYPLSTAGNPV